MATRSAIVAYREASLTSKRSRTTTSVTTFTNAIQHANDARFVATYRLRSYLFFSSGTIVIAQIPSPPRTRATTNADGYSGSGRYAYLLRESTGRIIQWIKIGTNVSACVNVLVAGNFENGTFGSCGVRDQVPTCRRTVLLNRTRDSCQPTCASKLPRWPQSPRASEQPSLRDPREHLVPCDAWPNSRVRPARRPASTERASSSRGSCRLARATRRVRR